MSSNAIFRFQFRKSDSHRIPTGGELAELTRPADDTVSGQTHADDRGGRPADVPIGGSRRIQLRQ